MNKLERLKSRFTEGFNPVIAVPEDWLPFIYDLDEAIDRICPDYEIQQIYHFHSDLMFVLDLASIPNGMLWDIETQILRTQSKIEMFEDMRSESIDEWDY